MQSPKDYVSNQGKMAKKTLVEDLDRAVEAMISRSGAPLPEVDSRIAPLIRIAMELRGLATDEFQSRLKHELLTSLASQADPAPARAGNLDRVGGELEKPPHADDLIGGRRNQLAELAPRNIAAALDSLDKAKADAHDSSTRILASLDGCIVGVARYSYQAPLWNRNPDAEELLHVLEGDMDVTSLTDAGPVHTSVQAGSVFVCRRGLWHWQRPRPTASVLFVRPEKGTEHSTAELPMGHPGQNVRARGRRTPAAIRRDARLESEAGALELTARNLRAALSGIPLLAISENTTGEEAAAAFPQLGSFNRCGLYVGRFSGLSPWERHTSADELLHVLEGELEITTLTDHGPVRNMLVAGAVFVCPRGLWHRQYSAGGALEFSATPQPTEVSFAEDPRL
jgi:quercetin dioxygenase-like cupin family protein